MSNKFYIIGNAIRFSPSTESLHLTENPDISVVLTPACNRLLIYLISNQGVVLSRDAIFSTLWVQYGSTPSNSSLNTYISFIRKAFVNLGMESEVITTIPKTGFLFNPDLNVEEIEIAPSDEINEISTKEVSHHINNAVLSGNESNITLDETKQDVRRVKEVVPDNNPNEDVTHNQGKKKITVINFVLASVALIIAAVSVACFLGLPERVPPVIPVNIGKMDACDILFLPVHAGDSAMLSEDNMRFIIRQSGFTCKPGGVFYLYTDKRVTTGQYGKIFVSYCELRDKSVKNCTDFIGDNLKFPVTGTH